ncbi:hypothetical protein [Cupriavidus sp. 8B]
MHRAGENGHRTNEATPTRNMILGPMLVFLAITATLSSLTKPALSNAADDPGAAYGTANATDSKSALIQAIANARGTLQHAQRSGRANDSQWYLVAKNLPRELSQPIADLGGYATGASVLNNRADSVWQSCGG